MGDLTVKIVVLDGRTLAPEREAWSGLDCFGELFYYDFSMPDEVPARAAGATILATNKTPLGQDLLGSLPELRFVTVLATGFDCVDIAAARRRGIPVSNVPVYGTDAVAQHVFALLLEMCHHVALHAEAVKAGEWTRQPDFSLRKTRLRELVGKTMGIVGHGRIGRRTGELAHALGMNVLLAILEEHPPWPTRRQFLASLMSSWRAPMSSACTARSRPRRPDWSTESGLRS